MRLTRDGNPEPDEDRTHPIARILIEAYPTGVPDRVDLGISALGPATLTTREAIDTLRAALGLLELQAREEERGELRLRREAALPGVQAPPGSGDRGDEQRPATP